MAEGLGFYSDLTEIAEGRITDLITHAEAAERRANAFLPQAGAYYRTCALTVFMAWRDMTEGWQALHDCERLARLSGVQDLQPSTGAAMQPLADCGRPRPRLDS